MTIMGAMTKGSTTIITTWVLTEIKNDPSLSWDEKGSTNERWINTRGAMKYLHSVHSICWVHYNNVYRAMGLGR